MTLKTSRPTIVGRMNGKRHPPAAEPKCRIVLAGSRPASPRGPWSRRERAVFRHRISDHILVNRGENVEVLAQVSSRDT